MKNYRLLICIALSVLASTFMTHAQVMILQPVAGSGSTGFGGNSGDNGPANSARVNGVYQIAYDPSGALYLADQGNNKIRKINTTTGVITTFAGNGSFTVTDGVPPTATAIFGPTGVALDASGNIYIAETNGARIRKIDATTGLISTFAGNGTPGYAGDGIAATVSQLAGPRFLAFDAAGNLFFTDHGNSGTNGHIRKISTTGIITTIAGGPTAGSSGDGGPASAALFNQPKGLAFDAAGDLYIADMNNQRVRKIDMSTGVISLLGGSTSGFAGDGTPVSGAQFSNPYSLSFDASNNLYISDYGNMRIRMVDASGIINTVAGSTSFSGYGGDGGDASATTARLNGPVGVAFTPSGSYYFSDAGNFRVRQVRPNDTPTFNNGVSQTMSVCSNASATSILSLLSITDHDLSQTEHWKVTMNPVNGTANATVNNPSNGGSQSPTGGFFSYTPTAGYSGLDSFQVQISDGIDSSQSTIYVNVNSYAGTISGASLLCVASTTTLSDNVSGGAWTSSNTTVATVDAAGVVSALTVGTADISYSVITSPCAAASAVQTVSVVTTPSAGTITGPSSVCVGSSITLSEGVTGGTWSISGGGIATITPLGYVNGASAGTAIVTYTLNTFCGFTPTTTVITVNPLPVAGTISGPVSVCVAATVTMSDPVSGGSWSYSNTTASISAGGIVTGAASGSGIVSYSFTNVCGTAHAVRAITISAIPPAGTITGPSSLCAGATITMSDGAPGGVWSASGPATVSSFGIVTGLSGGAAIITYRVGNTCGNASATASITVNGLPDPGVISGPLSICQGASVSMSDPIPLGAWSTGSAIATISSSGLLTGISGGVVTVSYSVVNACGTSYATAPLVINPTLIPSVGVSASPGTVLCTVTSPVTFSATPVNGGTAPAYQWYVNSSPVGGSIPSYTYSPASGDRITCRLTSNALCASPVTALDSVRMLITPLATPFVEITADQNDTLCSAIPVVFRAAPYYGGTTPTYLWQKNSLTVAVGNTYTVVPANGDVIRCRMTSSLSCVTTSIVLSDPIVMHVEAPVTNTVAVYAVHTHFVPGATDTFFAVAPFGGSAPIYQWYVDSVAVAGANMQTFITNTLTPGRVVSCSVISSDRCATPGTAFSLGLHIGTATGAINVPAASGITISPNPNNGILYIAGGLTGDGNINLRISNMLGQSVYNDNFKVSSPDFRTEISLNDELPNGVYSVVITSGGSQQIAKFVLSR